jgi:arylsulfatase I/J
MHAFHLIHTPLDVPASYLAKADSLISPSIFDSAGRRNYTAMVYYMDSVVGEIVSALKDKGIYDNTLIGLASDNGGPLYVPGSGNNHPLKGGKYSDWEGGVRTNALISGGYVPEEVRGTKYEGLVSIADWYVREPRTRAV